jgi:hypothetical protein
MNRERFQARRFLYRTPRPADREREREPVNAFSIWLNNRTAATIREAQRRIQSRQPLNPSLDRLLASADSILSAD